MKTMVLMKREIIGKNIRQDSKRGMFNANDLHVVGNLLRKELGQTEKQMNSYFVLESTKDLIQHLQVSEGLPLESVKSSRRGKEGGTWLHPIVFIDMAMWYSTELKVKVIQWAMDGLLIRRNDSGDSFKDAMKALTDQYPDFFAKAINYSRVCNIISAACCVGQDEDRWQEATEDQLKLRDKIHQNIIVLSDVFDSAPDCINAAVKSALKHNK